ncbi:MAG: 1,4-dihydroxy-2-naphthoate octaprenyltransferase [Flavobacteriales bacterium]|nr:1,4-dihydroxy-2-naphthoate octaprenyltransferase [Flavobacteriales bacterium]
MANLKTWISTFRLKTLPLSISGIIMGTFIAASDGFFEIKILILSLLTTLFLQILSNVANDYGDGVKGTDKGRIGDRRAVASGDISSSTMLKAVIVFAVLSLITGVALIWIAFGKDYIYQLLVFLFLGIAAIAAAMRYTMGKNPYGYAGLGDIFVFIFFGIVSVMGTYFLYTKSFNWEVLLPATSVGLLSAGVLNLNNLRDYNTDLRSRKKTLVVKIGVGNSKLYHEMLTMMAIVTAVIYSSLNYLGLIQSIFLIIIIPLVMHVKRVVNNEKPKELEPELKKLALITLSFSVLFGLGIYLATFEYFQFF